MTTYLSMNGTSDHLNIPSLTFTQIVMDVNVISNYSGIQERIWSLPLGAGYLMRTPNQVDEYSSNVSSVLVNGAQVTNDTKFIPINSRNTITSNISTTNKVYIFSNNGSNDFVQGNLYDIKFYNGSTLVAHYDMSTGTVNDQSGNGNNATLYGGTWVSSGTAQALTASDPSTVSDSVTLTVKGPIPLTVLDSVTATDSATLKASKSLTSTDGVNATDSANITLAKSISSTDSVNTTDSVTLTTSISLSGSDSSTVSDTTTLQIASSSGLAANDTIHTTDSSLLDVSKALTVSDNLNLTESSNLSGSIPLNASDRSTISENSPDLTQIISLSISDSATSTDNSTLTIITSLSGNDNLTIGEAMSLAVHRGLSGQDTSVITDSGNLTANRGLTAPDNSTVSESSLNIIFTNKTIISRVTLQGSRELHVILLGQRDLHIVLKGGVDVPAENQNFTLEAGTDKIIDIPGIVDNIASLDLTSCTEIHYEAKRGANIISKDLTNGIVATSPTDLSITLIPTDTHLFVGNFHHEVWCIDSNNKKTVLMTGSLTIVPSYADTIA